MTFYHLGLETLTPSSESGQCQTDVQVRFVPLRKEKLHTYIHKLLVKKVKMMPLNISKNMQMPSAW